MREALATVDSDLVRHEPRARSSRRASRPAASSWWKRGSKTKRGKRRLALIAGSILAIAIAGILANALLLQRTRHPAPLLGQPASVPKSSPARVAVRPLRPDAPVPATAPMPSQPAARESPEKAAIEAPIAPKPRQPALAGAAITKPPDPIGQLLKASTHEPNPAAEVEHRPTVPIERRAGTPARSRPAAAMPHRPAPSEPPSRTSAAAQPSRSIAAAQRALVKLGFVLEADGLAGPSTRKAIERYERDRGLPARGALSPDLVRRLGSESGIPID